MVEKFTPVTDDQVRIVLDLASRCIFDLVCVS